MTSDACPSERAPMAMRYDDIVVGSHASFLREVTDADIERFVDLSGDRNPIHLDDAYARSAGLGGRIAHGMLVGSFLSHLVGMHLPGRSALYLSQSLDFVTPVRTGDVLTVHGEVIAKTNAARAITLRTEVRRANEVVARGRAIVKVLE